MSANVHSSQLQGQDAEGAEGARDCTRDDLTRDLTRDLVKTLTQTLGSPLKGRLRQYLCAVRHAVDVVNTQQTEPEVF